MSSDSKPLSGQVAIVTGASSGIGAAVVRCLARAGASVAMAARRLEKLQSLQGDLDKEDCVTIAVKCDVTDKDQVKELVRHTEYTLGPVEILVNNAGIMYYSMMKNLDIEQWHTQIDLNCKGVVNCIWAVLDGMIQRKNGHIVNLSSDAGRKGFPGLAVYSGSKFFIEGFSQALRHEMIDSNIKVTTIQPGDVDTELFGHSTDTEARDKYDGSSGGHRILDPDDVARAILYAVSQPSHCSVNEILIEPQAAPI